MTDPLAMGGAGREQLQPPRSQMSGTLVSLAGWVIVIIPIIAMALIIFASVTNPDASIATIGKIALIFFGSVLLLCMLAAPHFLGQAVIHRERGLWRAALWTGIPTVGVLLYLTFRWLSNLS